MAHTQIDVVDDEEYTFKHYYYPLSDGDDSPPPRIKGQNDSSLLKRKSNSETNIDDFFEQPKNKKKCISSTVGRGCKGGVSYISTNTEDCEHASHMIKIEVYDFKKLAKVPAHEHWKHADVRVKYYVKDKDNNRHYQSSQEIIYQITKEIADSESCKKYQFKS